MKINLKLDKKKSVPYPSLIAIFPFIVATSRPPNRNVSRSAKKKTKEQQQVSGAAQLLDLDCFLMASLKNELARSHGRMKTNGKKNRIDQMNKNINRSDGERR